MRKPILDACCGSRMFWYDRNCPLTIFMDRREEDDILCDGRKLEVHPDIVADFTNMPFDDKSFKLVVFDPPHLYRLGETSWMAKKFGVLPDDWPIYLRKGVDECFRVLDDYGVLVFKWNIQQISSEKLFRAIGRKPLFGHFMGKNNKTLWMVFMKMPTNETNL